ncbi:hypothetical protein [Paracoccus seriniphilus]|uniref:hypothetical protein n=1 Tax=Paracoccus seriniphilus TaxID=184748 RepID=UPI0035626DEA
MTTPNQFPIPELYVSPEAAAALTQEAARLPGWALTARQLCDLELLMNGGFYPLKGFLTQADYDLVLAEMHLASGHLWPIPVTLDVSDEFARQIEPGRDIALQDPKGAVLAIMSVTDKWVPDKLAEARQLHGTEDRSHPGVGYLIDSAGPVYLGGKVKGLQPPSCGFHSDCRTPNELRDRFRDLGWPQVLAVQPADLPEPDGLARISRVAQEAQAHLLIQPIVGIATPAQADELLRVAHDWAGPDVEPSALNLATRMAGPREVLWHALVRRNHGATHVACSETVQGKAAYDAAQRLVQQYHGEAGVTVIGLQT